MDVDDKASEVDFNKQKRAIELQKMQGEQNEDEGFIPPPTKDNKGLDTERFKASAKKDKAKWLEELVATGDWKAIKLLQRGPRRQQGRLRNCHGQVVSSEDRAETLADHLETVQWKVRPVSTVRPKRNTLG